MSSAPTTFRPRPASLWPTSVPLWPRPGATLRDVLKTTVFVASARQADLVIAWEVIRAAFGDHDAPSTLLGVSVLGYPDQLVEIEAVAAITG